MVSYPPTERVGEPSFGHRAASVGMVVAIAICPLAVRCCTATVALALEDGG